MKRKILTIISFLLLINLFGQSQEILINIPEKRKAGNEFLLVVNIFENHMKGIARLQIELPNGFSAVAKKSMHADFKFEGQKAQFVWLNYPENKEVEVTLGVTTTPTIEGYFVIKGMGSWLENNEPIKSQIFPCRAL